MLTPAVSRRAASVGISTAQALKTGLGSRFSVKAGTVPLSQSNGKFATFASMGRQEPSRTPTVSLSPNIFARPFHVSAVCRPSCDWGSPCDCDECRPYSFSPICEICNVGPKAHDAHTYGRDRNDPSGGWRATSFCKECWAKMQEAIQREKEAEERIEAVRKEKVAKMLRHVRSLPPGEQVPLLYAAVKARNTITGFSASISTVNGYAFARILSKELRVVQVGKKRWMCDKRRVLAMDFDLWYGQPGEPHWGPDELS